MRIIKVDITKREGYSYVELNKYINKLRYPLYFIERMYVYLYIILYCCIHRIELEKIEVDSSYPKMIRQFDEVDPSWYYDSLYYVVFYIFTKGINKYYGKTMFKCHYIEPVDSDKNDRTYETLKKKSLKFCV